MTVIIDERVYHGDTAVALIEEIKELNWGSNPGTDAEGYIALQASTYKTMTGKSLKLPKGDTEARAVAMFKAIAGTGAWEFKEGE